MSSIRDFVPLDKLGEGTYSNVYKVKRVTDQEVYALKKVKMNSLTQKQKQNALNEVRILASIESEYIVGYKQAFFDENLNVLCVVMQHANDGDLQKYIKETSKSRKFIPQEEIWKAAEHISKGLHSLHSHGILHRDIKCANIFRNAGVYKLGDLNVSKVNKAGNLAYTQTGTPYYASPEVWRDEPYDNKSDIWSFGCIIYEMAALKPPFNGTDMEDLFQNVQKGRFRPLPGHYSNELWQFVRSCLQIDPKKRESAEKIVKRLENHSNFISSLQNKVSLNNPENMSNKQSEMLKTIKVPSDLKQLKQILPESKYKKDSKSAIDDKLMKKRNIEKKENIATESQKSVQKYHSSKKTEIIPANKRSQSYDSRNNQRPDAQNVSLNIDRYSLPNNKICQSAIQNSTSPRRGKQFQYNHSTIETDSYKSPKAKASTNRLLKSPRSEVRLSKKVEHSLNHSQRLQQSQRRPNTSKKLQNSRHPGRQMDSYIKEITQKLRKPISIPRTEKKKTLINNSGLMAKDLHHEDVAIDFVSSRNYSGASNLNTPGRNQPKNINKAHMIPNSPVVSEHYSKVNFGKYYSGHQGAGINCKYELIDEHKKKLVKKTRILSSNYPKPSWG